MLLKLGRSVGACGAGAEDLGHTISQGLSHSDLREAAMRRWKGKEALKMKIVAFKVQGDHHATLRHRSPWAPARRVFGLQGAARRLVLSLIRLNPEPCTAPLTAVDLGFCQV